MANWSDTPDALYDREEARGEALGFDFYDNFASAVAEFDAAHAAATALLSEVDSPGRAEAAGDSIVHSATSDGSAA